jgi:hypothetical protein
MKLKAIVIVSTLIVSACGGGGGSGTATAPQASTGSLIDSAVAGLSYRTGTQSGITNGQGNYKFLQGETVTFMLGNTKLFSAPATETVTPGNAVGLTATGQINLARFLQTLDAYGNPSSGINILAGLASLPSLPASINFDSASFDTDVGAYITAASVASLIPVTTLVSAQAAQARIANINSLIGTWFANFGTAAAPLPIAITFLSNGTYMMADDSNTTVIAPSGQPGIELGTYTYSNGVLATACPTINTDGEWGLSHPSPGVCTGSSGPASISGNILTVNFNNNGNTVLTRVVDSTNPLIGTWFANFGTAAAPFLPIAITFLSNGTYMMADDSNTTVIAPSGQPGIELGTYTYSNGVLATTCPALNTDGEWGLSHPSPGVCTGSSGPASISGNTLTANFNNNGNTVLTRVVP